MAFTPKTWADDAAGATPIAAAELNRIEQGVVDGQNVASGVMPKRFMAGYVNYNAATATAIGCAATTLAATASASLETDESYIIHTSGAISGNGSGMSSPFLAQMAWLPEAYVRMKTGPDVTNVRYWCGLTNVAIATMQGSATPVAAYCAFRYDTLADGTAFWRCVVGTGSATLTVVTTAVPVTIATAYNMVIIPTAMAVYFYINDALVATITTNIPAAGSVFQTVLTVTTLAALAKNIKWSKWELRSV